MGWDRGGGFGADVMEPAVLAWLNQVSVCGQVVFVVQVIDKQGAVWSSEERSR